MSNESDKPYAIKWIDKAEFDKRYPRKKVVNVHEWRKQTGQPPLNPAKEEITGCAYFPKHDPAILQAYAKKHNLKF